MRLTELFTGDLTHRELISYVEELPRESATARALRGPSADWTPVLHRLTDIADLLADKPLERPRFETAAEEEAHQAEMRERVKEIKAKRAAKAAQAAEPDISGG